MTLSYDLAYQEIILVHPTRRQIFAGKNHTLLSGTSETQSYRHFSISKSHISTKSRLHVSPDNHLNPSELDTKWKCTLFSSFFMFQFPDIS